jgi:bifunctional non-homologous end joining protein LigD
MQPVTAMAPFSSPEYFFEVKWDGLRCLLFAGADRRVRLQDRALKDLTSTFPELAVHASLHLKPSTVLDGELVAIDSEGRPSQNALRRHMAGVERRPIAYLAFDLLYSGGRSLLRQPLVRRRARLAAETGSSSHLLAPEHIEEAGAELFEACLQKGLEGVVAKHRDSTYVPGQRSPLWLKAQAVRTDDFVVVGATPGDPFGALLVAYHEDGRLLPAGAVSGAFHADAADRLARAMRLLEQPNCPLDPPPQMTAPVRWCRPQLVVSVRYSEWSVDGTIRFPIFAGVRTDIHPSECVRHRPRVVLSDRLKPNTPAHNLTQFPF